MKSKIELVVRLIFTLAVIYGAYTETGPYTAMSLVLISINAELISFYLKRILFELKARDNGLIASLNSLIKHTHNGI